MSVNINITVGEGEEGVVRIPPEGNLGRKYEELSEKLHDLLGRHEELVSQMGDHIAPFPSAGIDGFMSHFVITFEFLRGEKAGQIVSVAMPPSAQTVARSAPFIYKGPSANHVANLMLPRDCSCPTTISEGDFLVRPAEYFQPGHEVVWMQILNLDARMASPLGPIRIILGETLRQEHPDLFQPSHGVAMSLGRKGFPAKLFFNPCAVVETPFGTFRAIHGTLAYGRITGFPPLGTPVTITAMVPLESVDDVRTRKAFRGVDPSIIPIARIIALSHPIDMAIQLPGEEAFRAVERCIDAGKGESGGPMGGGKRKA